MGINETLKAISDPVRRDILSLLKGGKKSAGEISDKFSLTAATVSYHLSKLKAADLICEEKSKNFIYYRLNTSVFEEVLTWIYDLGGKNDEEN
ncbi:MAG: winged helix-turn-helix transcriptional regulator [Clostridia bacterium]|nr:winged helix-turn-helix transcriptional regulator [Clostridia bacterium]